MTEAAKPHGVPLPERRRRGRWIWRSVIALVALLVGLQLVAKFYLGLGDPPLMQADPTIEYLFQPNQTCHRFGKLLRFNAYSMRSDDFPEKKSNPKELRILVIGDSVVNGGAQTDQAELATSILQRELAQKLGRPVVVGNISAGSWGPPNELAYLQKYGLFDADIVVLVQSSHDASDVPTFEPIVGVEPSAPDRKPLLAATELITRYLVPYIDGKIHSSPAGNTSEGPPILDTASAADYEKSLGALRQMIDMARSRGARVIVAQHYEKRELEGKLMKGHDMIESAARSSGAEVIQMSDAFNNARAAGRNPYRDVIHPNAVGQRAMADVLIQAILSPPPAPATQPATAPAPAPATGPATGTAWR